MADEVGLTPEEFEDFRQQMAVPGRAVAVQTPKPPKNWRTTTLGILTLLGTAAYLGKKFLSGVPFTQEDFALISPALAGVGLLAAKDHNK